MGESKVSGQSVLVGKSASAGREVSTAEWKQRGREVIRQVLAERGEVTSDDVHYEIGDPPGDPNVMGSLFREAAKDGLISFTGRLTRSTRREAKGRDLKVWRASESQQASLL